MNNLKIKSRENCIQADAEDKLREFRDKFEVPQNSFYFMGNSLGLCPRDILTPISKILDQWKTQAIEAYAKSDWFYFPLIVGNKLGKFIGAGNDETVMVESTSVAIFKCLNVAIEIQKIDNPNRKVILLERDNFPTDNYIAEGFLNLIKSEKYELRYFDENNPIEKFLNYEVAVVLLSLVNYRTGEQYFFIKCLN